MSNVTKGPTNVCPQNGRLVHSINKFKMYDFNKSMLMISFNELLDLTGLPGPGIAGTSRKLGRPEKKMRTTGLGERSSHESL